MWFQKPPLGTPLDWGNPLNDETVLALAMNEGHGDKVQDLSLNGNHGTLTNFAFPPTATSGWNPGQTGIGLNFDSTGSNYIGCGNSQSISLSNGLTVSAIIYAPSAITNGGICAKMSAGVGFILDTAGAESVNFRVKDGVNTVSAYAGGLDKTRWNMITGVLSGRDATGVKIYVNGVLKTTADSTALGSILNAGNVHVGNNIYNAKHFNGLIDQPRIQSRAWSAKEVRDYSINPWQVYLDE